MHAYEVIRVHDGVDEAIEKNGEVYVAVVEDVRKQPVEEEYGGVMVNVEEGELTPLLPEHDKDGIPEIPNLGDVEEPKEVADGRVRHVELVARGQD